jgi:hypothetical protein
VTAAVALADAPLLKLAVAAALADGDAPTVCERTTAAVALADAPLLRLAVAAALAVCDSPAV